MNFKDEDILQNIKNMSCEELSLFAVEIREKILNTVSRTGGHLASNLGIVELTLALHKVFDSPKDKIVWDVGHQAYVHKLITGRWESFDTLRQLDGISGFPKRKESEHDAYDSGHSGTSISAALGYAKARDLSGGDYSCIAVIGDGALTGGVAFEALNAAGSSKTPMIVVLNDNGMSIGSNVGALSGHLTNLRTSKGYLSLKKNLTSLFGEDSTITRNLGNLKDSIKYAFVPGIVFEEFGFTYLGPVDGHDISKLVKTLAVARSLNKPVIVHAITKKGKGFVSAEKNPAKFHGIGPFELSTATPVNKKNEALWSEIFGREMVRTAREDEKLVAVSAAMIDSTGLSDMKKLFPERVFDAGIAEQHAVSFAAGLALGGYKPVVAIYSTFLQRAYDQIISEVCLQNLPVVFAIDRAGISGEDGETHQGEFDIAYLSAMPNMTLLSPKDGKELKDMLAYALSLGTPCAIRYPRGCAPVFDETERAEFSTYPEFVRNGSDMLMLSDGCMLKEVLAASDILEEHGISPCVANMRMLKPLNSDALEALLLRYKVIITAEDGCAHGGFGQSISSYAAYKGFGNAVLNIAWPDKFIEHGSAAALRRRYGLDAYSIALKAEEFFEKKA